MLEANRRQAKAATRAVPRPKGAVPKAILALVLTALACGASYLLVPDYESVSSLPVAGPEKGSGGGGPPAELSPADAAAHQALLANTLPVKELGDELVSLHAKVTSDVKGNLGDPQVIVNPSVADWLKDRWQSAMDMQGAPIEGEHWLELDLGLAAVPTKFVIDWESANSDDYTIEGRQSSQTEWSKITSSRTKKDRATSEKHIVDTIPVPTQWWARFWMTSVPDLNCDAPASAVRYVRLVIHKPATEWAPSVWRFEVYGKVISKCYKSPVSS